MNATTASRRQTTVAFDEIVVPLDLVAPYDRVLRFASALARRASADVRLVTVDSPGLDHTDDEVELQGLASELDVERVVSEVIESNDVAPALLQIADESRLLMVETRARGPLAAVVLGSTTNALLRAARRGVLLVGPATVAALERDLLQVCLDTPGAADVLVPVSSAWARQVGLRVRFVHAVTDREASPPTVREMLESAVERARGEFGVEADCAIVSGSSVAAAIVDDAATCGAAIVAIGGRSRRGLRRLGLGSESIVVAHSTPAAVLVVPVPSRS